MALSVADKIKLVGDLAVKKNFHTKYNWFNQNWLIRHMADHYSSTGTADAGIKAKIEQFLIDAKKIVDAKFNFSIGVKFSKKLLDDKLQQQRRVEIIYGTLGIDPDLALLANDKHLDFVIKRRYRGVMRTDFFVNQNSQGYFRYPEKCATSPVFRVNDAATVFWEEYVVYPPWYPIGNFFTLKPAGIADPVASVDSLFKVYKKDDICIGNLLDCARVMAITLMDSLQEAADAKKLYDSLIAKPSVAILIPAKPPNPVFTGILKHFSICHPTYDKDDSEFIRDSKPTSFFIQPAVAASDLQVGDYVYIYNHPLYKVFKPAGDWRGEHAYVYDTGNRNYKSQSGYFFGGHGKEGTLFQFYSAFMQELKTHLERAFEMARVHLLFRQKGEPVDGTSNHMGGQVIVATTVKGYRVFEYHVPITYKDYQQNGKKITKNQFLILHSPGLSFIFWIDKGTKIADIEDKFTDPIIFERLDTATAILEPFSKRFALEKYSIQYSNPDDTNIKYYPIFEKVGSKIRLNQIEMKDLFADPFAIKPGTTQILTTRPRVDLSVEYNTHLKTTGAIT